MLASKNCYFRIWGFSWLPNKCSCMNSSRVSTNLPTLRTFFTYDSTFILRIEILVNTWDIFNHMNHTYLIHPHIVHIHHRQDLHGYNTFHHSMGKALNHSCKPLLGKQTHLSHRRIQAHNLTSILHLWNSVNFWLLYILILAYFHDKAYSTLTTQASFLCMLPSLPNHFQVA